MDLNSNGLYEICKHCAKKVGTKEFLNHYNECAEVLVNCPYECDVTNLRRGNLEYHVSKICFMSLVDCPYAQYGCKTKIKRNYVKIHLDENKNEHMELLCNKINNQENDICQFKAQLAQQETEIDLLKRQVEDNARTLTQMRVKISNQEFHFKDVEADIHTSVSNQADEIEMLREDYHEKFNKQLQKLCHIEEILYGRSFYWKVNNVLAGQNAELNKTFYTQPCGYRLELLMYPNGRETGKNSHVSLYFRIKSGKYDDVLSWPFTNRVYVSLINPSDQNTKTRYELNYSKSPKEAFAKPPKYGANRSCVGSDAFMSVQQLHQYLRNDSMYLLVEVFQK